MGSIYVAIAPFAKFILFMHFIGYILYIFTDDGWSCMISGTSWMGPVSFITDSSITSYHDFTTKYSCLNLRNTKCQVDSDMTSVIYVHIHVCMRIYFIVLISKGCGS